MATSTDETTEKLAATSIRKYSSFELFFFVLVFEFM